jgi:hypothetical protein
MAMTKVVQKGHDDVSLIAYVPINTPLLFEKEVLKWHQNILKELASETFEFIFDEWNKVAVKVEHIIGSKKTVPKEAYRLHRGVYRHLGKRHFLRISTDLCLPNELVRGYMKSVKSSEHKLSADEARTVLTDDYALDFRTAISDIVILSNFAKPGCLSVGEGLIISGQSALTSTDRMVCYFEGSIDVSKKYGWPPINELNLRDVWNWAMGLEGFRLLHPMVRGVAGRALAAFANLFDSSMYSTGLRIVWTMIGLEALYGKGSVNTSAQFAEKSGIFLARPPELKRRFSNLYNFRSRLVHGDIDLPLPHRYERGATELDKFEDELWEHEDIAEAILISTLQKMVTMNLTTLEFAYVMELPRQK